MSKLIDLTGQNFGRLTVLKRIRDNDLHRPHWLCECSCGEKKIIKGDYLRSKNIKSCGCLRREVTSRRSTKHGCRTRANTSKSYAAWAQMLGRCTNNTHRQYKDYGGRGIVVCARWIKFENFLEDMGESPRDKSIDRIDNNKGYYKSNCRWATIKQQQRNKRNNKFATFNNKTQLIIEWAREYGISITILRRRLFKNGWSIEKTLMTPIRKRKRHNET